MNVLFVCYGNICRSPMAEGIAGAMFMGDDFLHVESAGLHAVPDNAPSENAVTVCLKHGIDIRRHRARAVTPILLSRIDLVFCMERYQCLDVLANAPHLLPVRLIGEDVPGIPDEIPDPYGHGLPTYERTFQSLTRAIAFHLGHLRERREYDRKAKTSG